MAAKDSIRDVLRSFNYGLFVVAANGPDGPRAATVSWVGQVSLDPRLISVALRKGTAIHAAVQASRHLVLHVVGADQPEFARAFFKVTQFGSDEIAGYHFTSGPVGAPVFDAAEAWLACEVVEEVGQNGDHTVFITQVIEGDVCAPHMSALALRDTAWHYGG